MGRYGPETQALLDLLTQQSKILSDINRNLVGRFSLPSITGEGGMFYDQSTQDKTSTFTDTEINVDGFNLVQILTDGTLTDVSYKIRKLDGTLTKKIPAQLSPQIVGYNQSVLISSSAAESGKTVYVNKWSAPWSAVAAIWAGSGQSALGSSGIASESRFTPIQKGVIFNTAVANNTTDFFGSNITLTYNPSLIRVLVLMDTAAILHARIVGASTVDGTYNSGNNIAISSLFMADLLLENVRALNFRHSVVAGLTVLYMLVQEIPAAAQ